MLALTFPTLRLVCGISVAYLPDLRTLLHADLLNAQGFPESALFSTPSPPHWGKLTFTGPLHQGRAGSSIST